MDHSTSNECTHRTNPWMVSTLVLAGFIVGFGIAQIPGLQFFTEASETAVVEDQKEDQQAVKPSETIDSDDTIIGNPDAKITVIEFSDFQCPYCAAVVGVENVVYKRLKEQDPTWEPAVPKLLDTYVKEGKVRIVFKNFPLSGHPQAVKAAQAGKCAEEQNKFHEMHDKLFAGQKEWSGKADHIDIFKKYAKGLGLDSKKFDECLDSTKYFDEIRNDLTAAMKIQLDGAPAFFVNDTPLPGAQPFSAFKSVIDGYLSVK